MIDQNPLEITVHGVRTIVCAYGFQDGKEGVEPSSNQLHLFAEGDEASHDLCNCFVGWVGSTPVIRTGSIGSKRKVDQFLALVTRAYNITNEKLIKKRPFRLSSYEVNSTEFDWNLIEQQHQYLAQKRGQVNENNAIIHLCTSFEQFYSTHPPRRKLASSLRLLHELPRLLNTEAWISYCEWYNDLLKETLSEFKYDAVDEYTMERYIIDFDHEVNSHYLNETKKRLLELELALGTEERSNEFTRQEAINLEKEMIFARKHLMEMLRAHYENLVEIIRIIPIIEEAHSELIPLKLAGSLLERLLASEIDVPDKEVLPFVNQQMMHQLLNDEMGVISAVNSNRGLDRSSVAFAIRLATLQLKQQSTNEQVIDLAVNWNEITQKVHRILATEGLDHFEEWVFQLKDRHTKCRVSSLLAFWDCFVQNLKKVCQHVTQLYTKNRKIEFKEGRYLNPECLNFLPPYIKVSHKGKQEKRMILLYDSKLHKPVDLTEEGHRFLLETSFSYQKWP